MKIPDVNKAETEIKKEEARKQAIAKALDSIKDRLSSVEEFFFCWHDWGIIQIYNYWDTSFKRSRPSHRITYHCKKCNKIKTKLNYAKGHLYIDGVKQIGYVDEDEKEKD